MLTGMIFTQRGILSSEPKQGRWRLTSVGNFSKSKGGGRAELKVGIKLPLPLPPCTSGVLLFVHCIVNEYYYDRVSAYLGNIPDG